MALTNKLEAIGNAIREKNGESGKYTLDQMPQKIKDIPTGGGEEAWTRPSAWPDLDTLTLEEQCVYATIDNRDRQAFVAFETTVSDKNWNIDIGKITSDGNFDVLKSETLSGVSVWKPVYNYFNDVDEDYPIIRITPVSGTITTYALTVPNCPAGSLGGKHAGYILEEYICLPNATAVNYAAAYLTQHIKLINCTKLTSLNSFALNGKELKLIEVERCDTSKVTNFSGFCSTCSSLKDTSFLKDLDFSSCVTVTSMFASCLALEEINLSVMKNTNKITTWNNMFTTSRNLKKINMAGVDTSAATNFTAFVQNTDTLMELNMSGCDVSNVTTTSSFSVSSRLGKFILPDNLNFGFNITMLSTRKEALDIFNQLPTVSGLTLTLGNSLKFLTDDDKLIATSKGWTLA